MLCCLSRGWWRAESLLRGVCFLVSATGGYFVLIVGILGGWERLFVFLIHSELPGWRHAVSSWGRMRPMIAWKWQSMSGNGSVRLICVANDPRNLDAVHTWLMDMMLKTICEWRWSFVIYFTDWAMARSSIIETSSCSPYNVSALWIAVLYTWKLCIVNI